MPVTTDTFGVLVFLMPVTPEKNFDDMNEVNKIEIAGVRIYPSFFDLNSCLLLRAPCCLQSKSQQGMFQVVVYAFQCPEKGETSLRMPNSLVELSSFHQVKVARFFELSLYCL